MHIGTVLNQFKRIFIAGIDTEVGKTYCSVKILQIANTLGYRSIGLKPIASGCTAQRNSDALQLQQTANVKLPYHLINPIALTPAIAPHIAAAQAGTTLRAQDVAEKIHRISAPPNCRIIIEGCGGWLTPLNDTETFADVVKRLKLPTILVVGMRLGCLNHSLLTAQRILSDGCELIGWIANPLPAGMACYQENYAYLKTRLPAEEICI